MPVIPPPQISELPLDTCEAIGSVIRQGINDGKFEGFKRGDDFKFGLYIKKTKTGESSYYPPDGDGFYLVPMPMQNLLPLQDPSSIVQPTVVLPPLPLPLPQLTFFTGNIVTDSDSNNTSKDDTDGSSSPIISNSYPNFFLPPLIGKRE
jgi:hypothetical protein